MSGVYEKIIYSAIPILLFLAQLLIGLLARKTQKDIENHEKIYIQHNTKIEKNSKDIAVLQTHVENIMKDIGDINKSMKHIEREYITQSRSNSDMLAAVLAAKNEMQDFASHLGDYIKKKGANKQNEKKKT